MEDISRVTAYQMFARRSSTENEVSRLIGQLVFAFSKLVSNLNLCVAWHNNGESIDAYGEIAEDLGAANLVRRIENQAAVRFGEDSEQCRKYKYWAFRTNNVREQRNIIMHSRWSIEPHGRHAVAISTPIFVQPENSVIYTTGALADLCSDCNFLAEELMNLREKYPL